VSKKLLLNNKRKLSKIMMLQWYLYLFFASLI